MTTITNPGATGPNKNGSTGPITDQGKAISSRNSLKHGCTATFPIKDGKLTAEAEARIVLPDESREEWQRCSESWFATYEPETEIHANLVLQAAITDWLQRRATRRHLEAEQFIARQKRDSNEWNPELQAHLERFLRYQAKADRAFNRARISIEQLRKEEKRDVEKLPPPPTPTPSSKPAATTSASTPDLPSNVIQLHPRPTQSIIQCITVQVINGQTVTLFQPKSESLLRLLLTTPEPKPVLKRAFYFLNGIPDEYRWITELEDHDGRGHAVIVRTAAEAVRDFALEAESGTGHVLLAA